MNPIYGISTFSVGVCNGYKPLPRSIKYGTMGLTTGVSIIVSLVNINPSKRPLNLGIHLALASIIIPFGVGSIFCLGNFVGKAIKEVST